jgi:hypothetical protein
MTVERYRGEDTDTTDDSNDEVVGGATAYFDLTLGGGDGRVALCSAVEWEDVAARSRMARPEDEEPSPPPMMGPPVSCWLG